MAQKQGGAREEDPFNNNSKGDETFGEQGML
jgi:hypothetical protein